MADRRPLIINSSAGQIQEITDTDGLIGNGTIPVGGIIMWSGTIADIPTGWALCNGSNGTPDLRNRFIVGAHSGTNTGTNSQAGPSFSTSTGTLSTNYEPGDIGGETAHQLTEDELASHTHDYDANRGASDYGQSNPASGSPSSGTTGSAGGDLYHENRPPYYALALIMRTI